MYKNNTIHIKSKNYDFGYELSKDDIYSLYKNGYDCVDNKYKEKN
jgi:hypothetical protein